MYEEDGLRGVMNSVSAYFDTKIQNSCDGIYSTLYYIGNLSANHYPSSQQRHHREDKIKKTKRQGKE